MSVIDALKKLAEIIAIKKRHHCTAQKLELTESAKQAVLKHLVIDDIGEHAVAVQLDKIGFADKVINDGHPARHACDAVIFCQFENQGYILILDMKSSEPSDNKHISQLLSGDCFADYSLAVLERFEEIKVPEGWQRRYFIFHCGNNKRTTFPSHGNPPDNNRADKASIQLVSNDEVISLRKLLHKPL